MRPTRDPFNQLAKDRADTHDPCSESRGGGQLLMAPSPKRPAVQPIELVQPQMIDVILQSLDDAKAEQTVAIDITGKSPLSDHMVVTTGRSNRHVGAVADQLVKALRENGFNKPRIE